MKIFSASFSPHDHNTYDGLFHNQIERYSRLKHNLPKFSENVYPLNGIFVPQKHSNEAGIKFYEEYYKPEKHEIFAFTTTIGGVNQIAPYKISKEYLDFKPINLWDYKMINNTYYIDHHQSHAAYAYLTSGFEESDILAIDGRGYNFNCIFIDKNQKIIDLSSKINIGELWNFISQHLGFGFLGAGKVMGLSAYGVLNDSIYLMLEELHQNRIDKDDFIRVVDSQNVSPDSIARTLQVFTEDIIREHIYPLQSSTNLCVAGGVAYNGYVNEMFFEKYENVHVPPAAGDEGQALGTYMHADYMLNNNIHIPKTYAGKKYNFKGKEKANYTEIAQAIANGAIVGWFQDESESGNRALGNRSILADPRRHDIKFVINSTIKLREDFRPFAPAVLEEWYEYFFDTHKPSPYMSRIMKVKHKDKIPGVTHVDNTARIQTVNEIDNPKFYKLITDFFYATGIPMLLNTSFNCQEPIVETPEEAIATFNKTAMDLLVINDYIIRK